MFHCENNCSHTGEKIDARTWKEQRTVGRLHTKAGQAKKVSINATKTWYLHNFGALNTNLASIFCLGPSVKYEIQFLIFFGTFFLFNRVIWSLTTSSVTGRPPHWKKYVIYGRPLKINKFCLNIYIYFLNKLKQHK